MHLACFAQVHEEDVTFLLLIIFCRFRHKTSLKDSLTCSSKSSRVANTGREIQEYAQKNILYVLLPSNTKI